MIRLTRPGLTVVRTRIADINRLHNIAGEEQFDYPVDEHAHLALQPRQLREVDAAPHQPGEQARKAHRLVSCERKSEFGTRGLMAHNAERAQRIEVKWCRGFAIEARVNVVGESCGLTQGELSSGGTRLPALSVGGRGAVAYRPKRMLSHHPERAVYDHRSALVLFDR